MSKRRASTQEAGSTSQVAKRIRDEDNEEEVSEEDMDSTQTPDFETGTEEEAEVGIIEHVSLKNFMCHSRLEFSFCPRTNFIIGRNGSGKSAILTALVVGLGGKATVTNRGTSVKGFIKTGKQTAEVTVRLRNRGTDAFKPEEYGDAITVERTFRASGGSDYRLKSKQGRIVSTKREELVHVLDHFNIQVDNPVAILNQDTSRNFLHSKNANDKYKFFLKATQLEQMKHDYCWINEQREVTNDIIQGKKTTLPKLEQEVLDWERKFKAVQSIDSQREKVKQLKHEIAWAQVISKERSLEPIQRDIQQEESRTPRFTQKVDECKIKVEECSKKHKDVNDRLKAVADDIEALTPQHDLAKRNLTERKKDMRSAQNDVRKLAGEKKNLTSERDQILERIEEIKNSAQQDYDAERRAREDKIAELQSNLEAREAQRRTTEFQIEQFRNAVTKYKEDQYKLKNETRALESRMTRKRNDLHTLESARSNKLKRYGEHIPKLLQRIEEEWRKKRFHQKPRGPLGACLKLVDPKWALGIESCLKSLLHAFACHDHHDARLLDSICREVCPQGRKPTIITSRFLNEMHDVSRNRAQSNKYPNILDMLEIEDHVVANTLIDQRTVECVLLIEDNAEARRVMGGQNQPANTREAFTLVGDQLYCKPTFRYYSSNIDKASFLKGDVEDDIRALKEELQEVTQELGNVRSRESELNNEIRKNQTEERKASTQNMKNMEAINRMKSEIFELKSIEDPAPVDVATLEEDIETLNLQLDECQKKLGDAEATSEGIKMKMEESAQEYKRIDDQIKEMSDGGDTLKEELSLVLGEIEEAKHAKRHYDKKKLDHEKKIADMKKEYEKGKKELEDDTAKAEQICPERIKTRRSVKIIETEIVKVTEQIKAKEKSQGNKEEITRKYYETKNSYVKIIKELTQFNQFLKMLQDVMTERQNQYISFRKYIALRTKVYFITLLTNRNYNGKMTFDHRREVLDLSVQPTATQGDSAKDMKALSGGERSFSTVCFILALWDAMESPFRCLDEFDVFMDMVNRRISMGMMMDVASNQKNRQFIFLTPQEMSLKVSNALRIYKMPDPERGSGVLPFESRSKRQEEEEES